MLDEMTGEQRTRGDGTDDTGPSTLRAGLLTRAIEQGARASSVIAGFSIFVLMGVCVADVSRRAIFGNGIEGAVEATEVALVAVVFAGMMAAQVNGKHIKTPMFTNLMPARVAHASRTLALTLAVLLVGWMTFETARSGIASFEKGEFRYGLTNVPVWPARLLIPVGLAGLGVALCVSLVENAKRFLVDAPAEEAEFESIP